MHLLGRSLQLVLNPGTPNSQDHPQRPQLQLQLSKGVQPECSGGDQIRRQHRGQLHLRSDFGRGTATAPAKVPPHFVTWGDGSSDEMCTGLAWYSASPPDPQFPRLKAIDETESEPSGSTNFWRLAPLRNPPHAVDNACATERVGGGT